MKRNIDSANDLTGALQVDTSRLKRFSHLIICDDPSPHAGGIQNIAFHLALQLEKRRLEVVVFGRISDPSLENRGIGVFKLNKPFRSKFTSDFRLLSLLLRFRFRYGRNVILYCMIINHLKVFRWVKPILGWNCVSFLHGNEVLRLYARGKRKLDRNIRSCAVVFANSRYTKNVVERIRSYPNVVIVHPGIPVDSFGEQPGPGRPGTGGPDGRKTILMLSRIVRRKGHQTVIRALAGILSKHPEVVLMIAGQGRYRSAIEEMVEKAGLWEHVKMVGPVTEEEKWSLFGSSDVYCMPSEISEDRFDVEGFGITLLEAAAMGVISIGADCGGMPDAIEDGKSGFLIKPGDHTHLEKLLDRVLSNPEYFEEMRNYARERALRDFSWDRQADRLLTVLDATLFAGEDLAQ